MTNFDSATRSFNLCTEGTQSYSWAWEGIDRAQALKDIADDGNDVIAYAHGWAEELCDACLSQINPEGERGFTPEEITNDLIDDRHALANAIQAWLEGDDQEGDDEGNDDGDDEPEGDDEGDDEDDQEPDGDDEGEGDDDGDDEPEGPAEQGLLLCLGSLGSRGITPAGAIYAFSSEESFRDQNPQWHGVELPQPRWHGITIVDDIDLPVEGGYQAEWGGNPTRSGSDYTYYPY